MTATRVPQDDEVVIRLHARLEGVHLGNGYADVVLRVPLDEVADLSHGVGVDYLVGIAASPYQAPLGGRGAWTVG